MSWERVEPEDCCFDHVYQHEAWHVFEWEHVVAAPDAILDGSNVSFDLGDVFIGATTVDLDVGDVVL